MEFEKCEKINANSILRWFTCCIVSGVAFIIIEPEENAISVIEHCAFFIVFVILFVYTAILCINRTYLLSNSVVCCRFGHIYRQIFWQDVDHVCIVSNFRSPSRTSTDSQIVIIPRGCALYDSRKWSGIQYKFLFRHQVICIDDSKRNRRFIEKHYGEIANMRHG